MKTEQKNGNEEATAEFDLNAEILNRGVAAPDKVPGLVTIDGIFDLPIPVGWFSRACWLSTEMDSWLQEFGNRIARIHRGEFGNVPCKTVGELVDFVITSLREKAENVGTEADVAVKRLGHKDGKWFELDDPSISQESAIEQGLLYEPARKHYWQVNGDDRWMQVNETQARRFLQIAKGKSSEAIAGQASEVNCELYKIATFVNIDHAQPVAGYSTGVYALEAGRRMLVTDSPYIIKPREGRWDTIKTLILEQLGEDQATYFFGWLKMGYQSLRDGSFMPGQAFALAGPKNCGKTFVQDHIITPILGGRDAKPYQYMVGITQFNSDLFKGEHLIISDENPLTDINSRRAFGSKIKDLIVNPGQRLHPKHRDPIMVRPFWRLSISVNDEPENLMMLPPLDDSMRDKLMLLRVDMPRCLPQTAAERLPFMAKIRAELPHFVHFLVNEFEVPENLQCGRFGITYYHNPTLAESINDLSPESHLLQLIDEHMFNRPIVDEWKGTSGNLMEELKQCGISVAEEIRKLCQTSIVCGRYLTRLAGSKTPSIEGRVSSRKLHGNRIYTIQPPGDQAD